MKTRRVAPILLALACGLGLPALGAAQGAAEQFAAVQFFQYCAGALCPPYSTDTSLIVRTVDGYIGQGVDPDGAEPAWSPDGARIAFRRDGEIWVVDYPGGSPVNVTNHPASDGSPAWSPDGSTIAFASDRDGQLELYLMNPDGSGVVRLTNGIGFSGEPAWSPDSARLAFDCVIDGGYSDICAINVDGTGFVTLTTHPAMDYGPAWSPDGSRIAFATARYSADPGGGLDVQLAVMNPDGTGVTQVGTVGWAPSWSPTGARILFVRMDSCDYMVCGNVYVINADGTGEAWVMEGWDPAWRPPLDPPAPEVSLSLDQLWLGSQVVGSTSPPQTVTLFNTGSADLVISGIAVDGDFAQTNTCGGGLPAGASCTIGVTFTPTAIGVRTGTVTITDNAPDSPHVVSLGGDATAPAPALAISIRFLTFGSPEVGITSPPQTVTLFNTGSAELAISAIAATGDFAQTTTCGPHLAVGASCTITVTFTPTATGLRTGAVTITDNAPDSPQVISVSGSVNAWPVASFTVACGGLTCTFNGSGSSDPDGTITSYAWTFRDGTTGTGATVIHTYATAGTYAVTLTVTDSGGATATQSQNATASQPTSHVGDLDRASTSQPRGWTATVTITIHGESHSPVGSATVSGSWSTGGTGACTTNGSGQCTVSKSGIPKKTGSVTFAVVNVTHPTMIYTSAANHDPDGDSSGTSITVSRP